MTPITILIVEDEAIVAADLAGKLEGMGYTIAGVAARSEEAIELAWRLRPQLLLMDILLAGDIDGIQTAEMIRKRYDVPVIYLTSHSDRATLTRAKATGPFGYILKPFNEQVLVTQIELALYKHQIDRQLREQRELLRVTLNSIGDAVISTDANGIVSFLNPLAERLTGWCADDAVGLPAVRVFRIVDDHDCRQSAEPVKQVLDTGCTNTLGHSALEKKDGKRVPIESSVSPIQDVSGKVIGAVLIFRDITERMRAEATLKQLNETLEQRVAQRTRLAETRTMQLQALAAELIEAEERERQRIADLLHEDLQQVLASASLHLQAACTSPDPEPLLAAVGEMITESIAKSRSLSYELSLAVLNQDGISAALRGLARQMNDQFDMQVDVETSLSGHPGSATVKILIFRAVQELLFNVVKHAGVNEARVVLCGSDGCAIVTVSDKGRGFDPGILDIDSARRGLGLLSLKERISYIGGSLAIDSVQGQGSRFTLTIPLNVNVGKDLSMKTVNIVSA